MNMLDEVDVVTFKNLGVNLAIIGGVAAALIFVSMYFSQAIEAIASFLLSPRETLIDSTNEMKHEAHGMQQPRPINKISEDASAA